MTERLEKQPHHMPLCGADRAASSLGLGHSLGPGTVVSLDHFAVAKGVGQAIRVTPRRAVGQIACSEAPLKFALGTIAADAKMQATDTLSDHQSSAGRASVAEVEIAQVRAMAEYEQHEVLVSRDIRNAVGSVPLNDALRVLMGSVPKPTTVMGSIRAAGSTSIFNQTPTGTWRGFAIAGSLIRGIREAHLISVSNNGDGISGNVHRSHDHTGLHLPGHHWRAAGCFRRQHLAPGHVRPSPDACRVCHPHPGACWRCTTRQHPHLPRYRTGRISGAACNTTTRASLHSARKPALTDAPHSILQVMVPPSTLGGNTENMLPRHSHHRYGQLHSTRERPTASLDDDTCKRVPQPYLRLPRLAVRCCVVICKRCGTRQQPTQFGSPSECPQAPSPQPIASSS